MNMTKQNEMPKVSIIIPVYNAEKYIKQCLESVVNQNYENLEIIVIDDGSIDNSAGIIKTFNKVKYFYQENKGQGCARNYGISLATGEWICFCDADDYLDINFVSSMVQNIEDDIGIVTCNITRMTEDGKKSVDRIKKTGKLSSKQALVFVNPGPTNKLFKRDVLKENNFLEGKIRYEDLAIFPKLMIDAKNVYVTDDILYYYRIYDDSTMRKWDDRINDIFVVSDLITKQEYYPLYKDEIDYLVFKHCLFGHLSRIIYFDNKKIKAELKKQKII